jgi:hypothetical protein
MSQGNGGLNLGNWRCTVLTRPANDQTKDFIKFLSLIVILYLGTTLA